MFKDLKENACYDDETLFELIEASNSGSKLEDSKERLRIARVDDSYSISGYFEDKLLIGVIIYHKEGSKLLVDNIGVAEKYRRRGVGRKLVMEIMKATSWDTMEAECGERSVDFFKGIGFSMKNIGLLTDVKERYRFEMSRTAR